MEFGDQEEGKEVKSIWFGLQKEPRKRLFLFYLL